ncbi:uncharacterized protein LOC133030597 [Cannabis sativa]|uniref:uncharacterized protein LOC133030597 n=1 Tax=Cannabis sativa TaxID=3483 RepID=UPI0029C9FAA1|nr:uncharacterized protein LOC133030597 [Cannabis sativa]
MVEKLRVSLGFEGAMAVDVQGRSGGVAMLWRDNTEIHVLGVGTNYIDVSVKSSEGETWRLTGLYGEPNRNLRKRTWELLRNLKARYDLPWCIIGDLNNVTSQQDKRGGNLYPNWLIDGFCGVLEDCDLHDMDLNGYPYTWERGRGTNDWIEVRIDRALVSQRWLDLFPTGKLFNLEVSTSDHCPLLLNTVMAVAPVRNKTFRFENCWLKEPICLRMVEEKWLQTAGLPLMDKVQQCGEMLLAWGSDYTGNFKKRIHECKAEIRKWKTGRDVAAVTKYKEAQNNLNNILLQREIFWKQRSKQLWLREGDQNSKFFHAKATSRRRSNLIHKLRNNNGEWVGWEDELPNVVTSYFQQLFAFEDGDYRDVLNCLQPTIREEQNDVLIEPVTTEEIKKTLFQMHPDKSPGPDGMTPGFYQKFWHIVGDDIVKLVRTFFIDETLPSGLNNTNIVLIPKKKVPESMSDLRPISLCNVVYKVISKVIANRLKIALPNAISTTQSAFLPGRLISDNIMVSFEIMHYLKRKRVGKEGCMALKLDMSKAYDRVGWSFLEAMLLRMGFCRKIVSLIMCCVSTVAYNVTYGGKVMGPILPRRGIRQGDPLSPYLFLVCAEGLSSLLQQYERNRWLTGCQVARGAPRVSHMLFADDSYVYCKANESEASRVLQLLQVYQRASGQQVNYAKSSIFFSNNTSDVTRQRMSEMLGMVEALENSFYLGLPCIMGRNKNAILGFLKDKMQKKIFSWESRFLSKAGKEVLLKSVAQALPSYAMSVFLLTKEICSNLEGLMSKFWWKSQASSTSKGVSWMSWKRLCRHKDKGGIGFRDLHNYNLAFLGKQGWRLLNNENSLVSRIYKARYYPSGSYLTASLGPNPSFIWRSIYEAKDLVVSGVRKAIGDGTTVNIIQDPWLPEANNPFVISDHPALEGQMVHSLLSVGHRSWDLDVIQDLFGERDRQLILSIQLSERVERDSWYWRLENSGLYTIKSAYNFLQNSAAVDMFVQQGYKQLWKIDIPPKVQHFLWRAASGCLPTRVQLNTRHVNVDNMCPFCHQAPETICHVLLNCAFSRACWNVSSVVLGAVPVHDFGDWFFNITSCNTTEVVREVAMVGWKIWAVRNDLVWNEKTCSAIEVVRSARVVLDQWKNAQSQKMGALLIDDINNVSERWRKPLLNMVKINVDGAIFQEENKFGFGLVVRDHSCRLIEAVSGSRFGAVHPGVAEVIGVKEALSWIKRKQWSNVVVETDALVVVQAIKGSVNMPSQFGMLVRDCRDLMATLNNVSLCFVKRSANKAAHCVARGSCSLPDCTFSEHDAPFVLNSIVSAESY